jgi:trimeric autotransporter adhesin
MKISYYLYWVLLFCFKISAQVGIGTTNPSGALDVSATNDGLLIPRVALVGTNVATVVTPTISELVYNTATSAIGINQVEPGFYYWSGTQWLKLITSNQPINNWDLNGNIATNSNFIGTTNEANIYFKRNNVNAGFLNPDNTVFGVNAMAPTTNAEASVAIGVGALKSSVSGLSNTAIGFGVLENTTTASLNTGIGSLALFNNLTGNSNSAFGVQTLSQNTTGIRNTALGVSSMVFNTTGNLNTAAGFEALRRNETGNFNTALGDRSLHKTTTANSNTAVGSRAMFNTTTGAFNTAVGSITMTINGTGSNNTAIGYNAMNTNTTGNNNTAIGNGAQIPNSLLNNQIKIGNAAVTYAGIQVPWSITSDIRWKKNIEELNLGLSFISKLKPVSYLRIDDETKKTEFGFLAQDLQKTLLDFKQFDSGIINKDDNGMLSVRYNDLLAPLVKSVQELNEHNKIQANLIEQLLKRIEDLEQK